MNNMSYAPPIYKIPESMKEENKNIAEENRKHFNEMKGTYIDPNNYEGEFPTVAKMVDKELKYINKDEDEYFKFEYFLIFKFKLN